ncbi:MAG: nitroreductase family protein [Clostridia bacterium]|nr:nitroreductase family protein [Clostridia bacterium]
MTNKELMSLLEGRRTYRRFDESRQISDEIVADMKRSAYLSSSAMNRQPLRYVYIRTPDVVNAIFDITSWGGYLLDGAGRPKIGERPTMFVAILSAKDLQSKYTAFDEGLAASNLTLTAWAHGVGSCILGSVKHEPLREMLDISDEYDISCVIGFGYPTHTSTVVDETDGDIKYRLDDNKNYIVPKRKIKDTVTEI